MNSSDDWITTQEAAEISGYHVNYLRWLIREKRIKAKKISFLWFVNRELLLDYLAQAEQSGDKRRGPQSLFDTR